MVRLLQHNYSKDSVGFARLHECDDARQALVQYLQEHGDAKLGLCVVPPSSPKVSTSDHSSLQLAKTVMDHHLHVATLCAKYTSLWTNLVDDVERAGSGKITMSLDSHILGAGPLFEWQGSASLRCDKTHTPTVGGDCSMRFESVMILACTTLAYLNSATAMRSYTTLAGRASQATDDASTVQTITSDLFAMNKGALLYALEAQQQLQLFRLAPTDSLTEMRPRTLEALASHASYCMQQMALPHFLEQHRLGTPSATRQLCAAYMALASLSTVTCSAAASGESTTVDASTLQKMGASHLAVVGQLSRSYNLVHAMVLRAEALLNEAHRRSENAETTRAQECLRGARLLALFSEQEARLGVLILTRACSTCPLYSAKNRTEVVKRWSTTCNERLAQWHEQVTPKVAHMLDLTTAAAATILPSGTFAEMDNELLQTGVHQLLRWLPQRTTQLSEPEVAQRLWHALQASGTRQYNGAQSLAQRVSPNTAVQEATRHVTTSPLWVLPPTPGAIREPPSSTPVPVDVTVPDSTKATDDNAPHVILEDSPSSQPMQTTPSVELHQLPRVPTVPFPSDEELVPRALATA